MRRHKVTDNLGLTSIVVGNLELSPEGAIFRDDVNIIIYFIPHNNIFSIEHIVEPYCDR